MCDGHPLTIYRTFERRTTIPTHSRRSSFVVIQNSNEASSPTYGLGLCRWNAERYDQFVGQTSNSPPPGDSDYLLRVLVCDVRDLERVILNGVSKIPGGSNIRSSIALKPVRYKSALRLPPKGAELHGAEWWSVKRR